VRAPDPARFEGVKRDAAEFPSVRKAAAGVLKAVVYDLDGTLVDSRGDLSDSVNAMLGALGLPPRADEEIWGFIGEGAERLVRRSLGPEHEQRTPEALQVWRREYARRLLVRTRPYRGIAELLQAPPDARAVLTNKPGAFAREILRGLGMLDRFRAVVGGDEGERKPDPGALLRVCDLLGASAAETLLVGDSLVDVLTGKAAGVPVCAVAWGLTARPALQAAGPGWVVDTPEELRHLLTRLRA
jgi:phosphoglycolate phosphatase